MYNKPEREDGEYRGGRAQKYINARVTQALKRYRYYSSDCFTIVAIAAVASVLVLLLCSVAVYACLWHEK